MKATDFIDLTLSQNELTKFGYQKEKFWKEISLASLTHYSWH